MLSSIKEKLLINREPGIFHSMIYEKLKNKSSVSENNVLKRKDVKFLLGKHTIHKESQDRFLKEMQDFGLIKIKNKQNIELIL